MAAPIPRPIFDFPFETVANAEPLRLLHNEAEGDVEFVVGPDGDTWRIVGHRDVLSGSSPVFKAMLTGPLAHEGRVRIYDVDGRAFFQLLVVLYGGEPDKMRSERACMVTMYAANKYLCGKLFLHCVVAADSFLLPCNVLRFMQTARIYIPDNMDVDATFSPTAPPLEDSEADRDSVHVQVVAEVMNEQGAQDGEGGLYSQYSPDAAAKGEIEELSLADLLMLLRRPTLHVRRESRVYGALERWANRDCRRRGLHASPENRRAALGEALFLVRYLRMSVRELLETVQHGVLNNFETAWLLGKAVGDQAKVLPNSIEDFHPPETFRPHARLLAVLRPIPRPCFIQLSPRCVYEIPGFHDEGTMTDWSWPMQTTEAELKGQIKVLKKILKAHRKAIKRQRRQRQQPEDDSGRRREYSSGCFVQGFFSVLACIFD
ncbi:BTB/POZ domain-containing protein 6-A-like [Thrips palmi]|uniref:BTB/POZ domain-containing protein 6-A-like n=1 Tax=Thrips palmi TaxID=161013 RepID=A0A6P9A2B1_THRPL|nr:BTB/POZ domain-containing protein 6-A-like [Thrips palmi]